MLRLVRSLFSLFVIARFMMLKLINRGLALRSCWRFIFLVLKERKWGTSGTAVLELALLWVKTQYLCKTNKLCAVIVLKNMFMLAKGAELGSFGADGSAYSSAYSSTTAPQHCRRCGCCTIAAIYDVGAWCCCGACRYPRC